MGRQPCPPGKVLVNSDPVFNPEGVRLPYLVSCTSLLVQRAGHTWLERSGLSTAFADLSSGDRASSPGCDGVVSVCTPGELIS